MQNAYCTFSNAVNKNVKRVIFAFVFSVITSAHGLADPLADSTPTPAAPDLTQIPMMILQEAQKNPASTYQIGDRINLIVPIPLPGVENGEHLNLKLPEGSSKLEDQGWYIDPSSQFLSGTFHFVASPIQTGSLTLPTLLISKEDQTVIGRTSPFTIQVKGPDKKDVKKPELLEITQSALPTKYWVLFSILALIAMGVVSYFIYRFLKNQRRKPKSLPITPDEPDHVAALRKIDAIYQAHPFDLNNLKPVAFGISETMKEFFSRRFRIDATEATTDEMIELLRKEAIAGESLREIQVLFQDLDLIKFTKSENYAHLDESRYFDFKIKAQLIIQKWTARPNTLGDTR